MLESQVLSGFGKTFSNVDFDTPDGAALMRLTRDVWQFSAAKNYQQMRDMTLALRDADGNLREFNDFKQACANINAKFNNTWLRTEYDTAIASAQMSSKWQEFLKNEKEMPFLRYSTVGDERVRTEHAVLDGIIRKITDIFWHTHYPPNGWGCRCDVDQLATSAAKETENLPNVPINPLFKTNLAQSGLIFPAGHAYYNGVPTKVLTDALLYLPDQSVFKQVEKWDTGKSLNVHILHGKEEIQGNIKLARLMAKYFDYKHDVDLMPEIGGELSLEKRKKVFGNDVFDKKCPDARINKELWDFREFKTTWANSGSDKEINEYYAKKLGHELNKKGKQAKNIAILLNEQVSKSVIKNAVDGYLKQSSKQRKIIIFSDGEAYPFETSKR